MLQHEKQNQVDRLDPHNSEGYNPENIERFIDRSLKNLGC